MYSFFPINRTAALVMHYLQSMKRNPARFIEIIVWPSFELLLFGMLALSLRATEQGNILTSISILSGVMYWNFSARIIQESVAQFLDDAFSKNIQNLLIAPFTLFELSLALIASSVIKLTISFTFLLIITFTLLPSLFSSLTSINALLLFELVLFGSIISIFALAIVFLFGVRVSFIGWFLSTALQVFSCVFFTREVLPAVLLQISYVVPTSYIFESMRVITINSPLQTATQPVIISLLVGYCIGAMILLKTAYKVAQKKGVLTKI